VSNFGQGPLQKRWVEVAKLLLHTETKPYALARGGGGEATAKPLGNCHYIYALFIDTHEADGAARYRKR
jgi:hypothetical protein